MVEKAKADWKHRDPRQTGVAALEVQRKVTEADIDAEDQPVGLAPQNGQ
jgi:hypothetical protein